MSSGKEKEISGSVLSNLLSREITRGQSRGQLARHPAFSIEYALPDQLAQLVFRLDRMEKRQK